jgi:peptidyl-prolyl cis-trans isomerase C
LEDSKIMQLKILLAAAVGFLPLAAAAASVPPEAPLIVDGPIAVDAADIRAFLLRVPEIHRAEVMASPDRIATMADNIFIARTLAARAREMGLDKDPALQRRIRQQEEAFLADAYLQKMDKAVADTDFEARARELFKADPEKYATEPERVRVQYLMVGLYGRTREMAAERARQLQAEAKAAPDEFLQLAARHSEDPDKNRNGGDLGFRPLSSFPAEIAKRIETLKEGEISEPIETTTGFHIVHYLGRRKLPAPSFAAVKDSIIKAEKERVAKERHEDLLRQIRSSKTVTVHRNNVEALVVPTQDALDKAAKAKSRDASKGK